MDPQRRPAEPTVLHWESEGNVAVMAGDLRQARAPTRRFHVPSAVRGSAARIDAATARELVANGALLVDVRRKDDPAVTLEGALRIPPDEISERLDGFSRDTPIVLACG
jgi:hypothetical protein